MSTQQDPPELPRYRLGSGIRLIERGADLQIGTAAGRRMILLDAPQRSREILVGLDGGHSADALLEADDDRRWWSRTLHELHRIGILQGEDRPIGFVHGSTDERTDLTHRLGADAAERALGRRADAVVEVRGAGRVAGIIAELLAAAGIGHVHRTLTRPSRPSDELFRVRGISHTEELPDTSGTSTRTSSRARGVQVRAALVVLAGDTPAEQVDAREFMVSGIPHLAVWAGDGRCVVGPLVLPGRSSCLWCLDLGRSDRDPDWAALRLDAAAAVDESPAVVLSAGAATLAAAEALHLIEGVRHPLTVDGTVEWDINALPRRRSWTSHPGCGCCLRP